MNGPNQESILFRKFTYQDYNIIIWTLKHIYMFLFFIFTLIEIYKTYKIWLSSILTWFRFCKGKKTKKRFRRQWYGFNLICSTRFIDIDQLTPYILLIWTNFILSQHILISQSFHTYLTGHRHKIFLLYLSDNYQQKLHSFIHVLYC